MGFMELLRIAIRYRRMITLIVLGALITSLLLCFLLPKKYTSTLVILPRMNGLGQMAKLSYGAISNAELMRFGGMNLMLTKVLWSESFMRRVVKRRFPVWTGDGLKLMSLQALSGKEGPALDIARRFVHSDLNGVVSNLQVSVETRYPELSYRVADFILEELNAYLEKQREQLKRINEEYYESRLSEARKTLAYCEEDLSLFLSKNRSWEESDHPGEKLELARLKRRQDIYTNVYLNLSRNMEVADNEIREIIPPLALLDYPEIPTIKSFPRKKLIVMFGALVALALSFMYVLVREALSRMNPGSGSLSA